MEEEYVVGESVVLKSKPDQKMRIDSYEPLPFEKTGAMIGPKFKEVKGTTGRVRCVWINQEGEEIEKIFYQFELKRL